jgi:glyoxylase-like metal-dependent hydrolase (beta-lactamase superfamily II)
MRAAAMLMLAAVSAACGARQDTDDPLADLPVTGDAPLDLAEDQDLELLRADFAAMPDQAPGRDDLRRRLAAEYARRLRAALEPHDHADHAAGHRALRALLAL